MEKEDKLQSLYENIEQDFDQDVISDDGGDDEDQAADELDDVSSDDSRDDLIGEDGDDYQQPQRVKPHIYKPEENDFEVDNLPPKLVVIQGPPKSGKTTLLKSLVKHYSKQNIKDPKGPITVRTGKKQRVTLIECPNNISEMFDLAKAADIVLTLIDGSLGFEMETFEMLSIMQVHGFPKCIGVATHLDYYAQNKQLKKLQKKMKKRFAKETTPETRLFWLKGVKNDQYIHRDVINLAR